MSSPTGIVTIGRNEGERLARCLRALPPGHPVVYADSGSTDGSVGLARSLGAEVVELDPGRPFSMARGRNEGLERLLALHPDTEFVQFMDGDCEVAGGWIEAARRTLEAEPGLAAVWGRLRELHPEASVYNRLRDIEWEEPAGGARASGGNVMVRVRALRDAGLFDPGLIAGEELDLCVRLRARGWRLRHLDRDMALHDAGMARFGQWWRWSVRGGWADAAGVAGHGRAPERAGVRESASIWFWALGVPGAAAVAAWPLGAWGLLPLAAYPVQGFRIFRRRRRRGDPARVALGYAALCLLGKWPRSLGQVRYALDRWRGREARLIEYRPRRAG